MARLNKTERNELYRNISWRYDEVQHLLCQDGMSARYASAMKPKEIMHRKYRIAYCLKEMNKYGLLDNLYSFSLTDVENLFYEYPNDVDLDEEEDSFIELNEEIIEELTTFGECYLRCSLINTNWGVHYIVHISDYELFSKEMIESMQNIISIHWDSMILANERYYGDEVFEIESQYLETLGISPEEYYEFFPVCNLVLTNSTIEQVIHICKKGTVYREWEEYKEFERYRDFLLFDRYFPDLCKEDLEGEEWKYMNYYLGEIYMAGKEEVGLYQLNYEAVLLMILADFAAVSFMERYNVELELKEGAIL